MSALETDSPADGRGGFFGFHWLNRWHCLAAAAAVFLAVFIAENVLGPSGHTSLYALAALLPGCLGFVYCNALRATAAKRRTLD